MANPKKKAAATGKTGAGRRPANAGKARTTPRDKISLPDRKTNPIRVSDAEKTSRGQSGSVRRDEARSSTLEEIAGPYRLHRQAIDDLATASPENSPPVSKAELRKYHAAPRLRIADWVKAILLKWWAGGMICYFFIWGLSTFAMNPWDHLAVLGIALGLVTHLIVHNIFRFIARTPGAYDRWMMFPGRQLWNLPLDILYALLLVFCTIQTYGLLNLLFGGAGSDASAALGVEPILFGLLVTLWDLLFLGAKHLGERILRDARKA